MYVRLMLVSRGLSGKTVVLLSSPRCKGRRETKATLHEAFTIVTDRTVGIALALASVNCALFVCTTQPS